MQSTCFLFEDNNVLLCYGVLSLFQWNEGSCGCEQDRFACIVRTMQKSMISPFGKAETTPRTIKAMTKESLIAVADVLDLV